METAGTILESIRKNPLSPTKSCSPAKGPFLNKESKITNFTGWDVDGRLNEMETTFKTMKEAFEGTMSDRKTMEDAIEIAKKRGMWLVGREGSVQY